MSTIFYLNNVAAPYTPATLRGAWDDTAGAVTKYLHTDKIESGDITSVARAETNAAADYDVLLYRGVSAPLEAQTISGTLDVMIGVIENATGSDDVYHIHAYVTTGDSDTPRGTLLTDYAETTANEWGTTASTSGRALASAQTLSSVACSAGDRIVIEIGYRSKVASATSNTGTLRYGGDASTSDLTAGGNATTLAAFVTFSGTITLTAATAKISQTLVEGALAQVATVDAQISQTLVEGALAQTTTVDAQISQTLVEVAIVGYVAGRPYIFISTVG